MNQSEKNLVKKDFSFGVIPVCFIEGKPYFAVIRDKSGWWSFPKGHKETGETDVDAALRELQEETGIINCQIENSAIFYEKYKYVRGGYLIDKTVKYFLGLTNFQKITIDCNELSDCRWFDAETALKILSAPAAKEILKKALKLLQTKKTI